MALPSSAPLAFVLMEDACVTRSIYVLFGSPFSLMASACYWTQTLRNGPSFLASVCRKSVCPYYSNYSVSPQAVACEHALALSVWRQGLSLRVYCCQTYIVFAPQSIDYQIFILLRLISRSGRRLRSMRRDTLPDKVNGIVDGKLYLVTSGKWHVNPRLNVENPMSWCTWALFACDSGWTIVSQIFCCWAT